MSVPEQTHFKRKNRHDKVSHDEVQTLKTELDLFVGGPVLVFTWRPEYGWPIEFVSKNVDSILGYSRDELLKNDFLFADLVHKEDLERVGDEVTQYLDQQLSHWEQNYRIRNKSGHYHWVYDYTRPEYDEHGQVTAIHGYLLDQTDLIRTQQALKASENRLKKAQTIAQMGSWECDRVQLKTTWSDELFQILEMDSQNVTPSKEALLQRVLEDDRERVRSALSVSRNSEPGHSFEYRLLMKDGRMKWVKATVETEFNEHGFPLISYGTVQDITHSKLNEIALEEAKQEAERANKAKSEFLSGMSHELRTPLNAVLGFAQLLQLDNKLSESELDRVSEISKAGKHLLKLVNDVLDLSKIEAGHINLTMEPVTIETVMQDCDALIRPMADKNKIRLSYQNLSGQVVQADRSRLKQVFLNLLSNAIKYNHPQGTVAVSGHLRGDQLEVRFSDSGYGIDQAQLSQLFKPFSRLGQERGHIEGSGVGLSISKTLIECMNGRIDYQPIEDGGSCFTVALPFASGFRRKALEKADDQLNSNAVFHKMHKRILYIEDNPANIKLISQLIDTLDQVTLKTAHEAELGIMLAEQYRPDLILLDINLPGMNGYQILKCLRDQAVFQNTPVLAVTANAMPGDIEQAMQAGFDECIIKPIDIQVFFNTVGHYLETPLSK